jgi:hypothetical protein
MSASTALLDLGSSFLRRLGNEATNGFKGDAQQPGRRRRFGGHRRAVFPQLGRSLRHFCSHQRSATSSAIAAKLLAALPVSACALRPA